MKKLITILCILLILAAMGIFGYSGYTFAITQVNEISLLVMIGGILIIALFQIISILQQLIKNKGTNIAQTLLTLVLVAFMAISSVEYLGLYSFEKKETLPNFYGYHLTELTKWNETHETEVITTYEYSDQVEQYHIMSQDVAPGTMIQEVPQLNVVISNGPNYDKSLIVPQMLGWSLDSVVQYIQSNYMNHVDISFEESYEEPYVVIDQDNYGSMYRHDPLKLVFSLGASKDNLPSVSMENLVGMNEFDATLWLKKNGIQYSVSTDFSNDVERNVVMAQSIAESENVSYKDKVALTLSKGKEITVSNLTDMTVEEVTAWVIDNNLNIEFAEAYDDTVALGSIIKANYKEGSIIEEGTTIKVTTSKGQLKMEHFNSFAAFKSWCNTYGVKYEVEKEYSTTIKSGGIIKFSVKEGSIIKNKQVITVTLSKGDSVTVPNFVGKSKTDITSECAKLGLSVSFVSGSYSSSVAKNVATKQSIAAGKKVDEGTTITITLSKGKAKSFTLYFSSALLGTSYNSTKNALSNYFEKNYPGVKFKFVAKSHNSLNSGQIHPDSPTKPGATVKQGKTYTIYIVK